MADSTPPLSTRSLLLWLALVLFFAGWWVPIRDINPYQPELRPAWLIVITPGLALVGVAPIFALRGRQLPAIRLLYALSLIFFCIALIWTPGNALGRHMLWIVSHTCATLGVWTSRPRRHAAFAPIIAVSPGCLSGNPDLHRQGQESSLKCRDERF